MPSTIPYLITTKAHTAYYLCAEILNPKYRDTNWDRDCKFVDFCA